MFLSSIIEELWTKEENNKAGCTFTFGGQCIWKTLSLNYIKGLISNSAFQTLQGNQNTTPQNARLNGKILELFPFCIKQISFPILIFFSLLFWQILIPESEIFLD